MNQIREDCSLCRGRRLGEVLRLPHTPIANEFVTKEQAGEVQDRYPLNLVQCQTCGHVQIGFLVEEDRLFGNYVYTSSTSPVTVAHLRKQAEDLWRWYEDHVGLILDEKSLVVEIGSNDGTFLKQLKELTNVRVHGIDPAKKIAMTARDAGIPTKIAFFDAAVADEIVEEAGKADMVVANNVFAHVDDVREMLEGTALLLHDNGVLAFEVSYLGDMGDAPVFDTIYHEHKSYHHLSPLVRVLDELDLPIIDVERVPWQLGRGSLRVICQKTNERRSIDSPAVREFLLRETTEWLVGTPVFFSILDHEAAVSGARFRDWLKVLKNSGQKIYGYGAPAKMTTLMYTWGLDPSLIEFVVEDSKWKQGLLTPGHHLPVVAPEELTDRKGTCIIFAWNFAESIINRNRGFRGQWLVPLPKVGEWPAGTPMRRNVAEEELANLVRT